MSRRANKEYITYTHEALEKAYAASSDTDISPEILAARSDIGKAGEYLSGLVPAQHQREWLRTIQTGTSSTALNEIAGASTRIAAPRGGAKTTWTILAIAWIIGHNPAIRIILVSYSEGVAHSISLAIKQIIASTKYSQLFPNITPSKRWADGIWFIDRHAAGVISLIKDPTILAVGAGGSIASRRADLVIIDDPIKNSKAITNPKIRKEMVKWWGEVLSPTLVPGGRAIVLCTRYRIDDIHGTTFTQEKGWQVIEQQAILTDDNGKEHSYWPEYISLEELIKKREDDPTSFASQYQNQPINEETQIISPSWIVRGDIPSTYEAIAIGVDLAASQKENADYSALVICGKNMQNYATLEAKRGRWTINQCVNEIIEVYKKYTPVTKRLSVIIERIAYQAAFAPELKRISIETGIRLVIKEVRPTGDKEQRLRGISGLLETRKVIFSDTAPLGILINELIQFGYAEHDDEADAFTYALSELHSSRKPMSGGKY